MQNSHQRAKPICRVNYKTHPIRKNAKLLLTENGAVGLTVQMHKQNYKERVIHTRDTHQTYTQNICMLYTHNTYTQLIHTKYVYELCVYLKKGGST